MFNINGEDWTIIFVSWNHPMMLRRDGTWTVGACDDESKAIYINENLDPTFMKKVLCHEITHAAMFSYNVHLSLEQEEVIADLIATYGQEIIRVTNLISREL